MSLQILKNMTIICYDYDDNIVWKVTNPVLTHFKWNEETNRIERTGRVGDYTILDLKAREQEGDPTHQELVDRRWSGYTRIVVSPTVGEEYLIKAFEGWYPPSPTRPTFSGDYLYDPDYPSGVAPSGIILNSLPAPRVAVAVGVVEGMSLGQDGVYIMVAPNSAFNNDYEGYPHGLIHIGYYFNTELEETSFSRLILDPKVKYIETRGQPPRIPFTFQKVYAAVSGTDSKLLLSEDEYTYSSEALDKGEIAYVYTNGWYFTKDSTIDQATVLYQSGDLKAIFRLVYGKQPESPYLPGGESSTGGGNGQFGKNEVSDIIAGDLPLGSVEGDASATGMYTRYLCNSSYLDLIGDWVWDPNLGLSLIQTAIKPLYNDPAQAMISLVSFPFQLSGAVQGVTTRSQDMYFGHQPVLGAQFTAILSSACYIDWGTIELQEYWGNFLDYYPHTKIEMYLPWGTGFVSIDPGQCLPGTLQVRTNIELARGSCVHNIINSAGCVIGSFAGQCGKQVPLIASDIAAKRAGLVTAAAGLIAGGAALASAGAVGTAAAGAAYNSFKPSGPLYIGKNGKPYYGAARMSRARSLQKRALSAAEAAFDEVSGEVRDGARPGINIASKSSIAALKTPISIQRNGGFTDGSAGMGIQYPYIILSRPEQNVPENYGQHFGYPSNIHSSLLFLKGYTEIGSVHLNGIPATAPELDELDAILKGGVIL